MKHLASMVVVSAGILAVAQPAWAVSLQNNDDREYEVAVVTGGEESSTTFTLSPSDMEEDVCESCKIMIEGVGEIDAEGSETIEISNGKLSRQGT